MPGRLLGKTCLVTAAAQGIGRAIAEAFLREGAEVIAIDLQEEPLRTLGATHMAVLDALDEQAVADLQRRFPNVSVLVNCVGRVPTGTVLETDVGLLQQTFAINVVSMHNFISAFLPGMRARRDGSIINIASVVSSVMGAPNRYAYGTTKGAVIGLTLAVARDFITEGIRCNAISPGTVETPSLYERMAAQGDFERARAGFIARQPMGRLGTANEVASVALLLASDEARFMTGANLVIDGGMSL
ncbi:MAG TPA: SDR family oxidoreductase [Steroidobacteraceae bacterium]|nr:SDR family oxidoreductase [Steroidobacteraceae bacterium]